MKILLKYYQIRLKNICNRIIVHKKALFRDEKRAYMGFLLLLVILNSFQDPAPLLLLYPCLLRVIRVIHVQSPFQNPRIPKSPLPPFPAI